MSPPLQTKHKNKDSLPDDAFNAEAQVAGPQMLQWVPVGKGGKVSNIRTVRSHVKKRDHERRKHSKRESTSNLTQLQSANLGPSQLDTDTAVKSSQGLQTRSRNWGKETSKDGEADSTVSTTYKRDAPPFFLVAVHDQTNNLIPYAWFEKDGPVLHVNRLKWPFSTPLNVTGSDRTDLKHKSLTPRQLGWAPSIRTPDTMAVKGAVLDPKVLRWIGQSPECFQFRVDIIKWIQTQLENPVKAISNITIGSVMTFAMWTAGCSNPIEMSNHMDAIERIVNLRGGFRSFHEDELMGRKLTLFDSMIAVQTGKPPRFPRVDYFIPQPISYAIDQRNFHQESPLYGSGDFGTVIKYHQDSEAIISLMGKMWTLTQTIDTRGTGSYFTRDRSPRDVIPFISEPKTSYTSPLLTLPLISHCDNAAHNHVLETLCSAGVIYSRVLANCATDFPSETNNTAFQQLHTAFGKCSQDEFWVLYPGILLWTLLVGTAAARAKEEAAFWMFFLSRTGAYTSVEGQLAGSEAIQRFLNIQLWIREKVYSDKNPG